jgi:hypothetical protein
MKTTRLGAVKVLNESLERGGASLGLLLSGCSRARGWTAATQLQSDAGLYRVVEGGSVARVPGRVAIASTPLVL